MEKIEIKIITEYIKLDQLLKFSGACAIGSEAKSIVAGGNVKLNGEVCLMRGKKIRGGDIVSVENMQIIVS
ncbi:MAG: RNA-binding S4 domain-containing protein [Oscillospiraceae bacterium]|nr:RNA-binding S4 domain-containing protein [Oscillospiraceae bacterium]